MAVELRPTTALLVLLVVLVAGSASSIVITEAGGGQNGAMTSVVPLDGENRHLWLYTSRTPSFDHPTLPINAVVYGDPDDVQRRLLEEGRGDWNKTADEEQDVAPARSAVAANATPVGWEMADGAQRYAYFARGASGVWLSEHYQVHDGDYLGSRHHVRAYTPPDDEAEWTAMQAHHEHWDWFYARHVVTSVDVSQSYLEREFVDTSGTPEITRVPVGAADSVSFERWLSVIDFRGDGGPVAVVVPVLLLGAIGSRFSGVAAAVRVEYPKQDARTLSVAVGLVALFMSVRLMGIGLERSLDVPPKTIAFLLYPLLFAGPPIGAYLLARPLTRARAFGGASIGFLAAVLVDYSYLGVTHIALNVLVHRSALAVAIGLVAIGSSQTERRDPDRVSHVRIGVLLWLVATVFPLLRHTPLPV